ncbi:hypothetical protein [Methylomonas rivi]|uniref:Uncharacterized protein n=1 Tax=Methylomonas rivi TaxID=2952226 RepID=A0ABT1U9H6_9GAMM|nr:hypothetical protein [Methylomonas sp. WSC-6]MCQ8130513.1 hypothetical protein [Methylomonas sp. WSC-6]
MSLDQALMEQMRTTVVGNVESVTKYEIDAGSKGGSIWVTKPTTGKNLNVLGNEIIKIKMPHEMFEQLKNKQESGEYSFPMVMEILCDIDMGGQNRAVLSAVSVRKYIPETFEPVSKSSDKKPGVNESKPSA